MSDLISAADSIMAVFGFKRVICAECCYSIGTDAPMLLCGKRQILVERDSQCRLFERDPGSDSDE